MPGSIRSLPAPSPGVWVRPSRSMLVRSLLAGGLFVACGCAATGTASPLAALKSALPGTQTAAAALESKPADTKTADTKTAAAKPATPTAKDGQEKAETAVATADAAAIKPEKDQAAAPKPDAAAVAATDAATSAKPAADPAKPEAAKPDATGLKRSATTAHDAQTLALIDEELRSAAPTERDALYEEWKSLDSGMVRQVIRIRRMVREKELFASDATPVDASQPAARPSPAATPPLGGTNPWSGPPTTPAAAATRTLALGGIEPIDPAATSQVITVGHSVGPGDVGRMDGVRTASVQPADFAPLGGASPGIQLLGNVTPVAGVQANGLPATLTPVPTRSASETAWDAELRQMFAAAEARAELARAAFAAQPAGTPQDEAVRRRYVETQVHLRMLLLMAGDNARAMQAIPNLDPPEQEFWQQVFWGLTNYFDDTALPNKTDRVSQTVTQLREAVARLQAEANLELRNVAFCHKITSFGSYERFDRDEYTPGQRVLLYAEVVNFKSVPQPADGLYRTQLKSTIEIFRAGEGQPVSRIEFQETPDLCRSYRQDYFHSYELKVPGNLALGPHLLKLTIEDIQSGKLATYSVNFMVK